MPKVTKWSDNVAEQPDTATSPKVPLNSTAPNVTCLLVEDTPTPSKFFQIGSQQGWNPFQFQNDAIFTTGSQNSGSPGAFMLLPAGAGLTSPIIIASPGTQNAAFNPFFGQGLVQVAASPNGGSYFALSPSIGSPQYFQLPPTWPTHNPTLKPDTRPKSPLEESTAQTLISDVKQEDQSTSQKFDDNEGKSVSETTNSMTDSDGDLSNVGSTTNPETRPRKAARSILETDDPVLSDKRRRNRIAAEKCRLRRKERQLTLEEINRALAVQVETLTKRLAELNEESQRDVKELHMKNRSLKSENQLLRSRLTAGSAAFYLASHHFPQGHHAKRS